LINEEALLFAQYLRNEKDEWLPRIAELKEDLSRKMIRPARSLEDAVNRDKARSSL
jgi:hypothetical protein